MKTLNDISIDEISVSSPSAEYNGMLCGYRSVLDRCFYVALVVRCRANVVILYCFVAVCE